MLKPRESALCADRIGKVYDVFPRIRPILFGRSRALPARERVTALAEVSLEVAKGEAVAVIGANGAGKSTLLRILSGLSRATTGSVSRRARLGTLLDLGAGLVDEWSGESNARSALSLQGTPLDRLAAVRSFADIGEFFDKPVRTYSTGMRLRLAYALAMGIDPEILIADEIVGVGDERFQRRCAVEMQRFLASGGTLVLATHNLYLAEKLCQRTLWLEGGAVRRLGATHDVTRAYRDHVSGHRPSLAASQNRGPREHGARRFEVMVTARGVSDGGTSSVISTGAPWQIEVSAGESAAPMNVDIRRVDGTLVLRLATGGASVLDFPSCPLLPGRFVLELGEEGDARRTSSVLARGEFVVRGARRELGSVVLEHQWT